MLLISPSFLASDYIANHELPVLVKTAAEADLKISPIHISPCSYERVMVGPDKFRLASLQAANPLLEELGRSELEIATEVRETVQ